MSDFGGIELKAVELTVCANVGLWRRHFIITRRSQVRIPTAQLVLTVAKSGYRRVIRKAGVARGRPFRVLSPVLATTCDMAVSLFVSVSALRATLPSSLAWPHRPDFGQDSRSSRSLAATGLTAVASAQSVATPTWIPVRSAVAGRIPDHDPFLPSIPSTIAATA